MNRILAVIVAFIILGGVITCKKSSTPGSGPAPLCTTCAVAVVSHPLDSTGLYYFLPTAFTPNGDGRNDVYQVVYKNLNADSSNLTIWNASGTGVFTGDLTQSWNGNDLTGVKCPAGKYNVSMKLVTKSGQTIAACTCVTILQYRGTCIYTGGVTYYFADQIDTTSGFKLPTGEPLCP